MWVFVCRLVLKKNKRNFKTSQSNIIYLTVLIVIMAILAFIIRSIYFRAAACWMFHRVRPEMCRFNFSVKVSKLILLLPPYFLISPLFYAYGQPNESSQTHFERLCFDADLRWEWVFWPSNFKYKEWTPGFCSTVQIYRLSTIIVHSDLFQATSRKRFLNRISTDIQ